MIPISDDNPTARAPIVTGLILIALTFVWLLVQGGAFDATVLAASVCNFGMVPGEITHLAKLGTGIPLGAGMSCVVDADPINLWTPFTSMFLHGSWMHLIGNALFLWVFGNNVEDSMSRLRFVVFYLLCGLIAAGAQIVVDPTSPVPMVGASGAISGVLGGYLLLYPRARVNMLFIFIIFFKVIPLPAWLVLLYWIGVQVLSGLPQLTGPGGSVGSGVAFFAHIGGFLAGVVLIKLFANRAHLTPHRRALGRA
jgi:membrane associated rhomboid family serine protease